jgi:cytochrome c556
MKYTHYDDSNLLDITYDLTIEFGISKDEPPYDIRIVAATVTAGNADPVRITNPFDLATINRMLDPSFWKGNESVWLTSRRFVDDVEIAIAEHLNELDQAAKELAAEAKFQAMRDGE